MAKEKFTVIYNQQDAGAQQWFSWKEKEIVTKSGEANAGGPLAAPPALITAELQTAKIVTIEAESAEEAAEAVRLFITRGPSGATSGGTPVATSGGFVNNKALAGKTASLSEVNMIP
jgi:hypothetical protein